VQYHEQQFASNSSNQEDIDGKHLIIASIDISQASLASRKPFPKHNTLFCL